MRSRAVFLLLTLALCFIPDVSSEDENQMDCSEFRVVMKNGKLFCNKDRSPVRGPDGRIYSNKCAMCKVILEKEARAWERTSRGERSVTLAKLDCSGFQKGERDGDFLCNLDDTPVCGTDGKTYRNRCTLCAENLKTRSLVDVKSEGKCESHGPKEDVCRDFREFVTEGRLFCTRENDPIQGPDGRTHGNKCAMCAELFQKEAEGKVEGKEETKLEEDARVRRSSEVALCKEFQDQLRSGRLFCTRESDPVQGPDGKTHGNKCAMCADIFKRHFAEDKQRADEENKRIGDKIKVKRETESLCREFRNYVRDGRLFCTRESDPVLGPDGKMHGNKCSMCEAFFRQEAEDAKAKEASLTKSDVLPEDYPTSKNESDQAFCGEFRDYVKNGRLFCTRESDPIRGPDGKMHGNKCSMCEAFFKAETERKKKEEAELRHKRELEKAASTLAELCNEFRGTGQNGRLYCTRENDPLQGPDGKVHGNRCSMCEAFFQQEAKAKDDEARMIAKREAEKAMCSEFRDQLRDGRLMCTRENEPVQGPDGSLHGNKCAMCASIFQREAGEKNRKEDEEKKKADDENKVKPDAEKDMCTEFRSLLRNGRLYCTRENDPVKGPDGKTHGNKCAMCKAVFQKEDEDRKKEEDETRRNAGANTNSENSTAEDPCQEFRSQAQNGTLSCTRESEPVRDADGKSYTNKCIMCKAILKKEDDEKKKKDQDRMADFSSQNSTSQQGENNCSEFRSQMKNGTLICTRESAPVRGPDGKMHGNKCAMCKDMFEREANERKQKEDEEKKRTHEGANSTQFDCSEFRSLIRDGKLICTRENDPVRGPDGKIHVNKCAMCKGVFDREALERKRLKANDSHPGNEKDQCSEYRDQVSHGNLICTRENDPVRDADGKSYNNKCVMCKSLLKKEADKKKEENDKNKPHHRSSNEEESPVLHFSNMGLDELCKQYRVIPRVGFLCPKNLHLVCGNDGQTYNNPCMLCHENLVRQTNVIILHEGRCEDSNAAGVSTPNFPRTDQ
ncbi:serine protease inhibitor Kazal-type 5 [Ornithorhynchus anatinus]|uniref:serine protease inhibitor Kazal-type 5 n=1 Tax=Ornithorhynchus anatinus TaxID=9258 RepID=UPI0010A7E8CA|nr:serine protease inhibitor Kazal-type 5 [Ornithorhynchus anatinus]